MTAGRISGLPGIVLTAVIILIISGCPAAYPAEPYSPSDEIQAWQEVLASDSAYPANVYLTENIEFKPGKVGSARLDGSYSFYGADGKPIESTKNGACGPPEGCTAIYSSNGDMTVLGSGGSAVWRFDPKWVIVNGSGDDFITFSNHNVFGGSPDGSWNELAHVLVSEDNINWYECSSEAFDVNSQPGTADDGYSWANTSRMHGNNHSWANFREDVSAEAVNPSTGIYETIKDASGTAVVVSKYFDSGTLYMGGDRFDLSDFIHTETGLSWPSGGRMKYLKLVDAPEALDGQDWNPDWMTGARIMSAMGINVETTD